jgi:small subunit ribosomal protein S4
MGDPKKQRKKYTTPSHPWQEERLEEEKEFLKSFGLKNKKEIWKINSVLKKFTQQAKKLVASTGSQSEIEKKQLMSRLVSLGLIEEAAHLEDVLTITPKNIMERRLQTIVHKKNLSRSIKQARQFITHQHIAIGGKLITSPAYLVTKDEETKLNFLPSSSLVNQDHAERTQLKEKKKVKKIKKPAKNDKTK